MPAPVVLILAAGRGERFLASGGNTHKCIGWRQSPEVAPYRWPFEENGRTFDLAIEPQITTNDLRLMLRLALAGGGITIATQETFRPYIESGKLVSLLDDFLRKRLVRTVLIFTESSDQLSRATDRVPGLPASPGYVQ